MSNTDNYIMVKREAFGEYSEKHSRFLGFVLPCKTETQATQIIDAKRKEHWDASHTVYAYVLSDGTARFSDDGEPHGTAGKPVLEVLKGSGVKNAVIVVVRYFGGILLGTGGLVRSYTAAATSALEKCEKMLISAGDKFSVSVGYGDYDKLVFILKSIGANIQSTDFADNIKMEFAVKSEKTDFFLNRISDIFSSAVLPKHEGKTEFFEKI